MCDYDMMTKLQYIEVKNNILSTNLSSVLIYFMTGDFKSILTQLFSYWPQLGYDYAVFQISILF